MFYYETALARIPQVERKVRTLQLTRYHFVLDESAQVPPFYYDSRLFEEMYKAFIKGRAEKNPAEGWYTGEKGFLDFYVVRGPCAR